MATRLGLLLGPMLRLLMLAPGRAQTACPPGMMAYGTGQGVNMCGPIPAPKYAPGWAALAVDQEKSVAISVQGKPSRQAAIEAAVAGCRSKDGAKCNVLGAFETR